MYSTTRKHTSAASRRLTRRAFAARQAERAFVQSVRAVEVTPQVQARIAEAKERATRALNAPFLEKYRGAA